MVAQIDKAFIKTNPLNVWPRILAYLLFEGRPLTTRGRWINHFVFLFFRALVMLPQIKFVKSPIFILGTGRSGTTILGMVLGSHREVGFLNEPKAIWAHALNDEDLVGNYRKCAAKYRLSPHNYKIAEFQKVSKIYAAYLWLSGRSRIVDKYPEIIFRTELVKDIFPDAKFIFLSRNGNDTCASIKKWSERLGQYSDESVLDWWGENDRKWNYIKQQLVPEHDDLNSNMLKMDDLDHVGRAAVEWILSMREGLKLMSLQSGNTLHVPYDALCNDPPYWLEKVRKFLNLVECKSYLSYGEGVLKPSHVHERIVLPHWLSVIFEETQWALNERFRAYTE